MNDVADPPTRINDDTTPWYALRTRSRHDKAVHSRLGNLGIEVFLPTVPRWNHWKDRTKQIETPPFPGYCFARFDVRDTKPVLECAGVVAIVETPGVPPTVSETEINTVTRLHDTARSSDPCPGIKEGMPVVVTNGTLLKSVSERLVSNGPQAWLVIAIELTGRAVSVRIQAADVHAHLTSGRAGELG